MQHLYGEWCLKGIDMDSFKDKLREIVTYHSDDGTSGYLLSEKQIDAIIELVEKEQNKKIGQLRQWLNEDRITDKKLVTNEEIELMLALPQPEKKEEEGKRIFDLVESSNKAR